ncbi:MAG: PD-(D/E)XK nuclease-like domain-containing protein [Flavobacteriaceae bacterium]
MDSVLEKLKDDSQYYGEFGKQYLSNSDIGTLLTNPKEFGVSRADNQAFAQGRLFHQLILEPHKAEEWEFVDVSSRNTKAYKEFIAEKNLEFALLEKENLQIRKLVDVMMGNMDFYDDIRNDGNEYEVPAVGEIEGLMWKGKADIVHPEMLIDIKTTSKISDFKWSARKYNYDSQCYIYQQLFGKPLVFYVIDKTNEMLGIFRPTEEFVKGGRDKVKRAVEVYHKFFSDDATDDINFYYVEDYL